MLFYAPSEFELLHHLRRASTYRQYAPPACSVLEQSDPPCASTVQSWYYHSHTHCRGSGTDLHIVGLSESRAYSTRHGIEQNATPLGLFLCGFRASNVTCRLAVGGRAVSISCFCDCALYVAARACLVCCSRVSRRVRNHISNTYCFQLLLRSAARHCRALAVADWRCRYSVLMNCTSADSTILYYCRGCQCTVLYCARSSFCRSVQFSCREPRVETEPWDGSASATGTGMQCATVGFTNCN